MSEDDGNPYAPPKSPTTGPPSSVALAEFMSRLHQVWAAVFVLNLLVPLVFSWGMTDPWGKAGAFAGTVALYLVGRLLCSTTRDLGGALVVGGTISLFTQLLPLPQILAGTLAIGTAQALGLVGDVNEEFEFATVAGAPAGAFVALVTGGALMTMALALGLFLQAMTGGRWWRRPLEGP